MKRSLRPAALSTEAQTHMVRLLQQTGVLLLALLGFLFCLVSGYRLTVLLPRAVLAAVAFAALFSAVFSVKRRWIAILFCLLAGLLFVFVRRAALLQGALLFLEQALTPMQFVLPESLATLLQPVVDTEALALVTSALVALLFFLALLCGYFVVCRSAMLGLALVTLPPLLPLPFYSLAPDTLPFFCLAAAHLMLYVYKSSEYIPATVSLSGKRPALICRGKGPAAQRPVQQLLSLAALPVVAITALVACLLLPEKGYVRPRAISALQEQILAWDIGNSSLRKGNDGLTHGSLRNLAPIQFSGGTALKVRVSEERPLYLRDFAGVAYTKSGWEGAPAADYAASSEGFRGIAPQNLHAAARGANADTAEAYTLAVQNVAGMSRSVWVPNGLVTTADEIEGAEAVTDTAFSAVRTYGVPVYAVTALPCSASVSPVPLSGDTKSAYRATLGNAVGLSGAGADAQAAAQAYLDYVFETYTALPAETQTAAEALQATYGLAGGGTTLYGACYDVYRLLTERCAYAYSPPTIPANADFTTYFLEESQSGYCVHFATAATVLLRSLGIPARYAEGYIVVAEDYEKQPDDAGFLDIEDTHAHAWVEVFDPTQLEWIPVEMTASANGGAASSFADGVENGAPDEAATPEPTTAPTAEPTETPAIESTPSSETAPDATPDPAGETEETPVPEDGAGTDGGQDASPSPAPGEAAEDSASGAASGGDDGSENGDGAVNGASGAAALPAALIPVVAGVALLACLAFGWRWLRLRRLKKLFFGNDCNAAVRAVCQYVLSMLRFAGCAPLLPMQSIEAYANGVSKALPWLSREAFLSLLMLAQRARFSKKACTKQERQDAVAFSRSLGLELSARLPRIKRMLFWWRFPVG